MDYSISDIARILDCRLEQPKCETKPISILLIDSRQLSIPERTIFFALIGVRRKGTDYISALYDQGVRHFVIDEEVQTACFWEANFLKVDDTLLALQKLAKYHRAQFTLPVLAITGSNGKTVVKEWLYSLLSEHMQVLRSPKSYNSQIGVPLSVWELNEALELAIFEAGISKTGEMSSLESVIRPTLGLITNLGSAHDEGFLSITEKLEEKLKLFHGVECLIYCKDHDEIDKALQLKPIKTYSWGKSSDADMAYRIEGNSLVLQVEGKERTFVLVETDQISVENVMSCLAFCHLMQISISPETLLELPHISMRMQVIRGDQNALIVHDAYSADLTSLAAILAYCQKLKGNRSFSIILSDILQSGLTINELYEQVAQILDNHQIESVYTIGNEVQTLGSYRKTVHSNSRDELETKLKTVDLANELILIKGARQYKLERIVRMLQEKNHETFLEVDLGAVARNLKAFEQFVPVDCSLLVMIKANAYGAGAIELAHFFESREVDYFGVAYIDEGVSLRRSGITTRIIVLNAERSGFEQLTEHQLEPELYSFDILKDFINYCRHRSIENYPVHLKLDTGMNRLGFDKKDIGKLSTLLSRSPQIHVVSVMSHLAASDMPSEVEFTRYQVGLFKQLYEELTNGWHYRPIRHILNSHGIIRYPEYCMEMVRLGIGVFGYLDAVSDKVILEPSHTLKARISQIKILEDSDTIGYSRLGKAYKGQKIATINVGYADGLFRIAGNGRFKALIRGKLVPIVGNVCMDMCMLDVSEVEHVQIKDEIIIFGRDHPIRHLAEASQTITYEILTSISNRVKRIYIDD